MRYLADIEIYGCPYCNLRHLHDPLDCAGTYTTPDTWLIHRLLSVLTAMVDAQEVRVVFGRTAA